MPTVTITNTDLIFIDLDIDGVTTTIKKSWCKASTSGNNLILKWFNDLFSKRYTYEQTIDEADVSSPSHTDINDLYSTIVQWLENQGSGGFSTVIFQPLAYTPAADGVETDFVISDAYTGTIMPVSNGIALKLGVGYTQIGNAITLTYAPDTLDIWGNKPL
jgi:hypothetical protein